MKITTMTIITTTIVVSWGSIIGIVCGVLVFLCLSYACIRHEAPASVKAGNILRFLGALAVIFGWVDFIAYAGSGGDTDLTGVNWGPWICEVGGIILIAIGRHLVKIGEPRGPNAGEPSETVSGDPKQSNVEMGAICLVPVGVPIVTPGTSPDIPLGLLLQCRSLQKKDPLPLQTRSHPTKRTAIQTLLRKKQMRVH